MLQRSLILLIAAMAGVAACAHLPSSGLPGPVPSPSGVNFSPSPLPSSSASPGPCATPAFGMTTVFVAMSLGIAPTTAPTYGLINGYVAANSDGTFNNVAQVVSVHHTDVLQFANADNTLPTTLFHSAVGFTGAPPFPSVPFAFPLGTQLPIATVVSTAQWSTGRIGPACYSQPFTLIPGTFYFGDFDYYNLTNMRDVIVVN